MSLRIPRWVDRSMMPKNHRRDLLGIARSVKERKSERERERIWINNEIPYFVPISSDRKSRFRVIDSHRLAPISDDEKGRETRRGIAAIEISRAIHLQAITYSMARK